MHVKDDDSIRHRRISNKSSISVCSLHRYRCQSSLIDRIMIQCGGGICINWSVNESIIGSDFDGSENASATKAIPLFSLFAIKFMLFLLLLSTMGMPTAVSSATTSSVSISAPSLEAYKSSYSIVGSTSLPLLPSSQLLASKRMGVVAHEGSFTEQIHHRSMYVREILNRRYTYVQSGRRYHDIKVWLKQQRNKGPTVFSMHGRHDIVATTSVESEVGKDGNSNDNANNNNDDLTQQPQTVPSSILRNNDSKSTTKIPYGNNHKYIPYSHDIVYTFAEPMIDKTVYEPAKLHKDDPFSKDRMNLDLVVTDKTPRSTFHIPAQRTNLSNNKGKASHNSYNKRRMYQQLVNDDVAVKTPSTLRIVSRFVQLVAYHFLLVISTSALAVCNSNFRNFIWYKLVVKAMGTSGAAFIKWGQWASTRNDMFPTPFCDALAVLHNEAPIHSTEFTKLSIEHSLGINDIDEVMVLDPKPLASGSVAQVHRAFLKKPGNDRRSSESSLIPVAIKVRHPSVATLIDIDFRIMNGMASFIELCFPQTTRWLHLSESIQQFSSVMSSQSLLHVEGHHLELFNFNFYSWQKKGVSFPKPIYASTCIIIESFERGITTPKLLDQYRFLAQAIPKAVLVQCQNHPKRHYQHFKINRWIKALLTQPKHRTSTSTTKILTKLFRLCTENCATITTSTAAETTAASATTSAAAAATATTATATATTTTTTVIDSDDEIPIIMPYHDLIPIPLAKFIVTTGVAIYLKMLLLDNLMHADLHPGNILIDVVPSKEPSMDHVRDLITSNARDGRDPSGSRRNNKALVVPPLRVSNSDKITACLVDAGMVAELTDSEAAIYIGLLASLGEGNGKQAADFTLQFSMDNNAHLSKNERQAFIEDTVKLFAERCRGYGTNVDLGRVLQGILILLGKHKVRVDANFATLVVNVLCVQGLASDICPEYNTLDSAKPLLQAYRRVCFTPDGKPIPNIRKSRLVRLYLSSKYLEKKRNDDRFFRKLEQNRKKEIASSIAATTKNTE